MPNLPATTQRHTDHLHAGLGHEAHVRSVRYVGGHWFASCACGWLSGGLLCEGRAWAIPCEVETLLVASADRRRLLHGA